MQDPRRLGDRAHRVGPVPGLGVGDQVDAAVAQRQVVAVAEHRADPRGGAGPQQPKDHWPRVERDDAGTPAGQGPGRDAGAGSDVEHVSPQQRLPER